MMLLVALLAAAWQPPAPDVTPSMSALLVWDGCVTGTAERYSRTAETAEIIADAVLTFCREFETEFQRRMAEALRALPGATALRAGNDAWEDAQRWRRRFRAKAVTTILEARAR